MPKWRDLAIGIGAVALVIGIVVLRSLATPPVAGGPETSAAASAELGSTEASPSAVASVSETTEPSMESTPTASAVPTVVPTAAPTTRPTAKPAPTAAPIPTPIPWVELPGGAQWGISQGTAGTQVPARFWNMSASATCSLSVTYADATVFNFASAVAVFDGPVPGSAAVTYACYWTWSIPANAAPGIASFTIAVDYLGMRRIDSTWTSTVIAP